MFADQGRSTAIEKYFTGCIDVTYPQGCVQTDHGTAESVEYLVGGKLRHINLKNALYWCKQFTKIAVMMCDLLHRKKRLHAGAFFASSKYGLTAIVHVKFDRVSGQAQALYFFVLEGDITIDHIVGENTAGFEEIAVLIECFECRIE